VQQGKGTAKVKEMEVRTEWKSIACSAKYKRIAARKVDVWCWSWLKIKKAL